MRQDAGLQHTVRCAAHEAGTFTQLEPMLDRRVAQQFARRSIGELRQLAAAVRSCPTGRSCRAHCCTGPRPPVAAKRRPRGASDAIMIATWSLSCATAREVAEVAAPLAVGTGDLFEQQFDTRPDVRAGCVHCVRHRRARRQQQRAFLQFHRLRRSAVRACPATRYRQTDAIDRATRQQPGAALAHRTERASVEHSAHTHTLPLQPQPPTTSIDDECTSRHLPTALVLDTTSLLTSQLPYCCDTHRPSAKRTVVRAYSLATHRR